MNKISPTSMETFRASRPLTTAKCQECLVVKPTRRFTSVRLCKECALGFVENLRKFVEEQYEAKG